MGKFPSLAAIWQELVFYMEAQELIKTASVSKRFYEQVMNTLKFRLPSICNKETQKCQFPHNLTAHWLYQQYHIQNCDTFFAGLLQWLEEFPNNFCQVSNNNPFWNLNCVIQNVLVGIKNEKGVMKIETSYDGARWTFEEECEDVCLSLDKAPTEFSQDMKNMMKISEKKTLCISFVAHPFPEEDVPNCMNKNQRGLKLECKGITLPTMWNEIVEEEIEDEAPYKHTYFLFGWEIPLLCPLWQIWKPRASCMWLL